MKIINICYKNPDVEVIKGVARIISQGGLVIVPGDAVYTIVTSAFSKKGLDRIIKLKKRRRNKFFNLGLYCLEDINRYAFFNPLIYKIKEKFPQEPFTFVLSRKKEATPSFLNPGIDKLGFRIPLNRVTSSLSKCHRLPVVGTSANISGLADSYNIGQVLSHFQSIQNRDFAPKIILDAGPLPGRKPSTIIDLSGSGVEVIREGELTQEEILKSLKS